MKKILLAFLLVVSMAACAPTHTMAQNGGGLFQRGETVKTEKAEKVGIPGLPGGHGQTGNQSAPIGSGALALTLFGAAYLVGKKTKENR